MRTGAGEKLGAGDHRAGVTDLKEPIKVLAGYMQAKATSAYLTRFPSPSRGPWGTDLDHEEDEWVTLVPYEPLADAITDLALNGHPDAAAEALQRLCDGSWQASGHWKWWAWANAAYEKEGQSTIPPYRWQALQDGLVRGIDGNAFTLVTGKALPTFSNGYTFGHLFEFSHEEVVWFPQKSEFRTALVTGPDREEVFSAWQIEVVATPAICPPTVTIAMPEGGPRNRGGRPPVVEWEAAALAMAERFYRGDFKPRNIADVVRGLQDWASEQGQDLAEATARPHAKRYFEAFKAWDFD